MDRRGPIHIAFAALVMAAATTGNPAAGQTLALGERPAAMPRSWLQFRLNDAHNPVIAAAGTSVWRVETRGQISASPSIVDGILYVGTNGGVLYAIDAASGNVRWRFRAHNGLKSNPLVYDGLVIVGEGNADSTTFKPRRKVRVGSGPSGLVALDAHTGRKRWYRALTGTGQPTATIVGGILVHHDGDGFVVGLDPRTGNFLYRRNVGAVSSMAGAIPVGNLIVTTGIFPNRVMAVRSGSGSLAWTWNLPASRSGIGDCPPASDGARVFCDYLAPAEPWDGPVDPGAAAAEHVYGLDGYTGRRAWDVALESGTVPDRNESAIPMLYRHTLFVGSAVAPYVHAIDCATGRLLWRRRVRGPVKGGIVASDGVLYFGDLQGYLWALDAASGKVIGVRKTATSYNVGSPIIVGGSLVLGSNTGSVVSLPLTFVRAAQDA